MLLRQHRLAAGVSQEVLAEQARMSVDGISALERGHRRSPYRETVALLVKALSLPPAVAAEFEAAAARRQRPRARTDRGDEGAPATNLPSQRTNLVGRETEIANIAGMLQDSRLVTVTGAGRVGKTRTALAVGDALLKDTTAGVWLVELAPLAHESIVAPAVAQALNVQESPNHPVLETLLAYLRQKPLLLILDNCEHVIAEAAAIADALLRGCLHLRILATSREPLRITGERIYRLPSLNVPTRQKVLGLNAAQAAEYAAVVLFSQRAQAIDHEFALSDDNAPIVAEICWRLDGIALAIELAAARVKTLTLRALSQKLDQRFRILTGGDRTALPRHRTMRALIDWSYDLLSPPEQRLFERLSIFAGGCDLARAATVYDGDAADELDVLEIMSSLVEKSLVVADLSASEPRYRLLESAREYAREQLAARGEAALVARRHALAYAELARRLVRDFLVGADTAWFVRTTLELENWRAALEWTLGARRDVTLGQRLAVAMLPTWAFFSPVEGRRYLAAALELVDERTPALIAASVENAVAQLALVFRDFEKALSCSRRALPAFRELGKPMGVARALHYMGTSLVNLGRVAEGEPLLCSALDAQRSLGVPIFVGEALQEIAVARAAVGDISTARAYMSEALASFDIIGGTIGGQAYMILAKQVLAEMEFCAGNAERAAQLMPTLTPYVPPFYLARHLISRGAYFIACNRLYDARACSREALDLAREMQDDTSLAWAIQHLATIAALTTCGDGKLLSEISAGVARLLGYVNARVASLGALRTRDSPGVISPLLPRSTIKILANAEKPRWYGILVESKQQKPAPTR
jgi:predicted ATPase